MGKIADYRRKVQQITIAVQEVALLRIIDSNKSFILDLNTGQLMSGKDSQGNPVKPPYKNKEYAEFKRFLNPRGVVDLKVTGDFHNSFYLDDDKFPIKFGATDEKTTELVDKYGDQIFGLTPESMEQLRQHIAEEVRDYYRTVFNVS